MKVILCDDQKEFLEDFGKQLDDILSSMIMGFVLVSFTDPERALEYIISYMDVDLIFMDILMGEKNGYETAKRIRKISPRCKIIFLSATTAYALKGYSIQAVRYLTKPVKKTELICALDEIVSGFRLQSINENFIVEKNDFGIHKLYFDEIIYIETCKRNTLIHTTSGSHISYKSMKEHEKRLNNMFFRCHSSYIVNLGFVKDYHGYEVYLLNNDIVWVSKHRKKEFLYTLTRYYGEMIK